MKCKILLIACAILLLGVGPLYGAAKEDPKKILKDAIEMLEADDWQGAREETSWALEIIEQKLQGQQAEVFPLKVLLFERGEIQTQKMMGMEIIECTYTDPDGNEIEVQLMGGSGKGPLGNIAQMGAMFQGGDKVRIQRRGGSVMREGGETRLNLELENGKSLNVTSRDVGKEKIVEFTEEFPVAEVDEAGS